MRWNELVCLSFPKEEGKDYSLLEGYRIPPVMFTEKEAMALFTAEALIKASKDTTLIAEFSSAVEKIKAVLSYIDKSKVEQLERRMVIGKLFSKEPLSQNLLTQLQGSLHFVIRHKAVVIAPSVVDVIDDVGDFSFIERINTGHGLVVGRAVYYNFAFLPIANNAG